MLIDELLMIMGSFIIIASWFPQIIKILRTRSSRDISIPFLIILLTGTVMMIPHSFVINDIYFMALGLAGGTAAFIVLLLTIKYRKGVRK